MKQPNKIQFILELFWLVTAIILAVVGIINSIRFGFKISYMFFIMSFLAALLYLARHYLRTKSNNED